MFILLSPSYFLFPLHSGVATGEHGGERLPIRCLLGILSENLTLRRKFFSRRILTNGILIKSLSSVLCYHLLVMCMNVSAARNTELHTSLHGISMNFCK